MDNQRFDAWIRAITTGAGSRRSALRALVGGASGIAAGSLAVADAKKKKKKKKSTFCLDGQTIQAAKSKKKKLLKSGATPGECPPPPPPPPLPPPALNSFGCVDVGGNCRGDSGLCCSGVCQGPVPPASGPDTSTCVAHNAGDCTLERNICLDIDAELSICGLFAVCAATTGNAPFCASQENVECRNCRTDSDCEEQGLPPGSACVLLTGDCLEGSPCVGSNGVVTVCAAPGA